MHKPRTPRNILLFHCRVSALYYIVDVNSDTCRISRVYTISHVGFKGTWRHSQDCSGSQNWAQMSIVTLDSLPSTPLVLVLHRLHVFFAILKLIPLTFAVFFSIPSPSHSSVCQVRYAQFLTIDTWRHLQYTHEINHSQHVLRYCKL